MAWSEERARGRIRGFIESAPASKMVVESFKEHNRKRSERMLERSTASDDMEVEPLLKLGYNQAVVTHGVHIYANLLSFNETLMDDDKETEASHRRAMQFLHLHYQACDQLIDAFDIQRVDFHGQRLHAVVLLPEGDEHRELRAQKAIAFSDAFLKLVKKQSGLFNGSYDTEVRIGIDCGVAIALNSGRGSEPEPLFVGSPANHAAKLSEGDAPGVYISDNVRADLGRKGGGSERDTFNEVDRTIILEGVQDRILVEGKRLNDGLPQFIERYVNIQSNLSKSNQSPATFNFSAHPIPLKSIDFSSHPPSKSIRMPMASLFVDIDGFTAYIDNAVTTNTVHIAVRNLHVIRRELAACLRDDFGGKKVRFIGDCLHAITSKGTVDSETVEEAILVAGGLRSSFNLLIDELDTMDDVGGIAIGVDVGDTPVSRIGLKGTSSVRCSTSKATCNSEALQKECGGEETKIGDRALNALKVSIKNDIGHEGVVSGLDYSSAEILVRGTVSAKAASVGIKPIKAYSSQV